eukprot:9479895-Pyramimonas_sp.AAC.1
MSHSRVEQTSWDYDRLAQALRRGTGVQEFVRDLERAFDAGPDYHDLCLQASSPDEAWARWITTVYGVAEEHFGKHAGVNPRAQAFAAERSRLLAERRRIREADGDGEQVCMALARASRRLRVLRRS